MRQSVKPFCCSFLVMVLSVSILAQNANQTKPGPDKTTSPEKADGGAHEKVLTIQQQHALGLLDHLFETSKDFTDGKLKIQIQARIADALWEHDEPRARQYFEDAFHGIDSVYQDQDKTQIPYILVSDQFKLRSEILRIVARRDMNLAEKLTKSVVDVPTKNDSNPQLMGAGGQSEQSELYLQMAQNIAETDPGRASQMARESLKRGLNASLIPLVQLIRKKNAAMADNIFTEALAVAKSNRSQASQNIALLMPYVFPNAPGGGFSLGGSSGGPSPVDSTNPVLIAQFLNFAYDLIAQQINSSASAIDNNRQIAEIRAAIDYSTIQRLMPFFDQYMPDKSAAIRAKLEEVSQSMTAGNRDRMNSAQQKASVPELLARADAAKTPQEKDGYYMSAALTATQGEDPEQAILILEKISTPGMDEPVGSLIRMWAASKAISRDDYDLATRVARNIPSLQQRALVFGAMANRLVEKKDMVRAREFLSDAEASLLKAKDGPEKANALIQVTSVMARVDPIRAFDTMRSTVDAINHATFQDENAPIKPGNGLVFPYGLNTFNFDGALTPLARTDFQRSLLLAQAIEKKEASTLAQISVCRGVLVKTAEQSAAEKAEKEEKEKKDETVKPKPDQKAPVKKPVQTDKPARQ